MLVDSHAHLDSPRLWENLQQVLERARQAGVDRILTIACVQTSEVSIAERVRWVEGHAGLYLSLGVHPHDANCYSQQLEDEMADLMTNPGVLGWGEIGLDFYYDHSSPDVQAKTFRRQLCRARELGKPVIIHSRDSAELTLDILSEEMSGHYGSGVLMHCFTYDLPVAERCIEAGHYLSFGGILTFPRSEELRRVACQVPSDRYLIETDSPYLAPVPHRGKTNEPAFVLEVARRLAEIRSVSVETVARQSSENFERFFGLRSFSQAEKCRF